MITSLQFNLEAWWQKYQNEFVGQSIQLGKNLTELPLVQRKYAAQSSRMDCPEDAIPFIEITSLYRQLDPSIPGILFVNCNPSGTDYQYYNDYYIQNGKTSSDFVIYDKEDNTYFNAAKKFAIDAGVSLNESNLEGNYAMIDVFPLAIQNQAVLKKAYNEAEGKRREAFEVLLKIFIDNVVKIKPKVIVATNAFVKNLLTSDDSKTHPRSLVNLKLLEAKYEGDDLVRYKIRIQPDFETTLFCGGMIAGGHQMDTESRARLYRDVRHFFSGDPIPV